MPEPLSRPRDFESGAFPDLVVREAIASVAMSHENGCSCVVCRANAGDLLAFVRICEGRAKFSAEKTGHEEPR